MNIYLRIVLNIIGFIDLYTIGLICLVLSGMLKYILRLHRSLLPEIYLIRIKAKNVDIEPRSLPVVPDCFKTRGMCEKAVKKYLGY